MPLNSLTPQPLWRFFQALCDIPHPSKHEAGVVHFLEQEGKKLGLETQRDRVGNLIIRIPPTAGMEDRKGVVLQSHVDMVPQKRNESNHDFLNDPIRPYIQCDWVKARDTTLGADNGIGVAAMMAVLSSKDLSHGPIEALFTIDEEAEMTGAFGLESGLLQGDILLNLDSEQEGELYVGCAGGVDVNIRLPITRDPVVPHQQALSLALSGLKGGHSGVDIHLGRGNANKLLIRLIRELAGDFDIGLTGFEGGSLSNAIPRDARATIILSSEKISELIDRASRFEQVIQSELGSIEPDLCLDVTPAPLPKTQLSLDSLEALVHCLTLCPNGVLAMHPELDGVVQTSSNLATVRLADDAVEIKCLVRSALATAQRYLCDNIASSVKPFGGQVLFEGAYPGWKPNLDSPMLKVLSELYLEKYSRNPEVKVIHAGLECGLLGSAYPNWDMVSFGPTIRFPHSPDEQVQISSVARFWEFLCLALERVPKCGG